MKINASLTELIRYRALLSRLGWSAKHRRPDLWERGLARIFGAALAGRMMEEPYELVYQPILDEVDVIDRDHWRHSGPRELESRTAPVSMIAPPHDGY